MRSPPRLSRFRAAFTLVELLMVMFIMAFITTLVASNAFGISRSASFMSAQDLLYNTLVLAHQQACMNNHEVCVVFLDETSFVLVEAVGTAQKSGGSFIDSYPQRMSTFSKKGLTLWNIDDGKKIENATLQEFEVLPYIPNSASISRRRYGYKAIEIANNGGGSVGNLDGKTYGVETLARQALPKGFKIGFNSRTGVPKNSFVRFRPDGSCAATYNLYAYEVIRPDQNYVWINVSSDGSISVKKDASGK